MTSTTTTESQTKLSGYATSEQLYSMRYRQGGRTVYSVALTPDQIVNLIQRPDPSATNPGNRRIRPAHAQGFASYFNQHPDWVAPGIILRSPPVFEFAETVAVEGAEFGVLSYPKRAQGDIQILDGQHRILGFHLAMKEINDSISNSRTQRDRAKRTEGDKSALYREAIANLKAAEERRDRFYTERVMVEIHVTDNIDQGRQIFFDIAENQLGMTASVKARFDTRKAINRALPFVFEHPLLQGRLDLEIDRISRISPYWMSARHIAEILRVLTVGLEGRISRKLESELKEGDIARGAADFFDMLVKCFPPLENLMLAQLTPEKLRTISLLGSPLFIRILAGVYYELTKDHGFSKAQVADYFTLLAPHMLVPIHENTIWARHTAEGVFDANSSAPNGRRQDIRSLTTSMVEWAIDHEPFVSETPVAAPEPEVDPDEGIDFAPSHDTLELEIEERIALEDIAKESKARGRQVGSKKKVD